MLGETFESDRKHQTTSTSEQLLKNVYKKAISESLLKCCISWTTKSINSSIPMDINVNENVNENIHMDVNVNIDTSKND